MSVARLLLITGIPGAGKTCYGNKFEKQFGFAHYDIEDTAIGNRFSADPTTFIAGLVAQNKDIVVTWGFNPEDQFSVSAVGQFQASGFKLIWFDGDRPAALREFIRRGTVPQVAFYMQMYRIEASQVINAVQPMILNPFDVNGQFKTTVALLKEIS